MPFIRHEISRTSGSASQRGFAGILLMLEPLKRSIERSQSSAGQK